MPTFREILDPGQRTVEQLVDRYPIACRPVRDLLVDYLKERQPSIDYATLQHRASQLARLFWADLEQHHPGIDIAAPAARRRRAWKQRLRTRTTTAITSDGRDDDRSPPSGSATSTPSPASGRSTSTWPSGRWRTRPGGAPWVAPCPIRPEDLERRKIIRRRKARMDARTRERLPVLPVLVRAAARWRDDTQALLAAAPPGRARGRSSPPPGRPSSGPPGRTAIRATSGLATQPPAGSRLLNREEDHAFWAWAIIEVLRHTGIRVEELLELSHHSLVQYRLPDTGELVPLLQIAPSKTDAERLLVVSPELADVLSAIICRVRGSDGAIPLVRGHDRHELVWLPPSPLLFQRRIGTENHVDHRQLVADRLDAALARTGLTDPATGGPLRFTPHDFRRLFITDAVLHGLPPHIAQVIAGHRDINVTMGYKAVYPEEAIRAHRAFLARRRALRPTEEYRVPTDEEWQEFLGHFERRKVSIGTCGRAFGTPCIHEHACVRCPMLWPDPAQRTGSSRSATTSPPASPRPSAKAGSARSKDSRSASPAPTTSSPRSTRAKPATSHRPRDPHLPAALTATTPVGQLSGHTSRMSEMPEFRRRSTSSRWPGRCIRRRRNTWAAIWMPAPTRRWSGSMPRAAGQDPSPPAAGAAVHRPG